MFLYTLEDDIEIKNIEQKLLEIFESNITTMVMVNIPRNDYNAKYQRR